MQSTDVTLSAFPDARFGYVNGQPALVLHSGDYVQVKFDGLSTLAGGGVVMSLDADCNNDGDYDNDQAAKAVEPGVLVSCPPTGAENSPQDWAKIRLLGHSADVSAGLVWLHAAVSSTGGQIRVWSDRSTNSTLLIDSVAGTSDYSRPLSTTQPLGSLPEWLYVEGVSNSSSSGDVTLQACYGPSAGTTSAVDRLVISVMQLSLRIDSSNQWGTAVPPYDPGVAAIKTLGGSTNFPGKIIFMNDMDVDGDGIPDFLDGFELPSGDPCVSGMQSKGDIITGGAFVPVVLSCHVPHPEKAYVTFNYNANDPGKLPQMTLQQATAIADAAAQQNSMPNGGYLRLWTKDASQHRKAMSVADGGDYIPGYSPIPLASIMTNGQTDVILYAEGIGVTPQWGMEPIKVLVTPAPKPDKIVVTIKDSVTYSVVRCVYQLFNFRPYKCLRDTQGNITTRVVARTRYDSPRSVLEDYIAGEQSFDDYRVNGVISHGMGAFMGHTFSRLQIRSPTYACSAPINRWLGQTGENDNKQNFNALSALEYGTVWWFRAGDGRLNFDSELQDYNDNFYLGVNSFYNDITRLLPADPNNLAFVSVQHSPVGDDLWVYTPSARPVGILMRSAIDGPVAGWTLRGSFGSTPPFNTWHEPDGSCTSLFYRAGFMDVCSSGNGLPDLLGAFVLGTDTNCFDSTGSPLGDYLRVMIYGLDPLSTSTVGDGIPDAWKIANGIDPLDPTTADQDPDGDGICNRAEYLLGTNPHKTSTLDSSNAATLRTTTPLSR